MLTGRSRPPRLPPVLRQPTGVRRSVPGAKRGRDQAMIDRFLTRIAGARGFLAKLWVLTRPYWYAGERHRIGLWGYGVSVKECWIARALLATTIALSVLIVYISKLINSWNARFFNALQDRNADAFWSELGYWIVIV